jgi:hypothetical protein
MTVLLVGGLQVESRPLRAAGRNRVPSGRRVDELAHEIVTLIGRDSGVVMPASDDQAEIF